MDGTTEPIIAVLGHPIAGNPSQFAVERALRSMKLDWRVLSFDVRPQDIAAALEGFLVLGIEGVLVDVSVAQAAAQWYAGKSEPDDSQRLEPIDCFSRDPQRRLVGSFEQRSWLQQQTAKCDEAAKDDADAKDDGDAIDDVDAEVDGDAKVDGGVERWIWLGDFAADSPLAGFGSCEFGDLPPDPDQIDSATCILIADEEDGPVELEAEDWPPDDGSTLVVDLTDGHPEQATLERLGYRVVNQLQRRIGTLSGCLQRWTGKTPPREVIHDAIEEYLGV